MDKSTRAIFSLRPEWRTDLDRLKQEQFYDVSYAEMYRQLLRLGIEAAKKQKPA